MRDENKVRSKGGELLEVVINPQEDIDDFNYERARFGLDALLWVLEEFDHIPVKK